MTTINYQALMISNLTAVRVNVKSGHWLSQNDLALLNHFERVASFLK